MQGLIIRSSKLVIIISLNICIVASNNITMLKLVIFYCFFVISTARGQLMQATAVIGFGNSSGFLKFAETAAGIRITGTVSRLTPGAHGFHVHVNGNLAGGCITVGPHFNPQNVNHGGPTDKVRHIGDLGNINAGANGEANVNILDRIIALRGPNNIIGRPIVVNQGRDDFGRGGFPDSLINGHSGTIVGCGLILAVDS